MTGQDSSMLAVVRRSAGGPPASGDEPTTRTADIVVSDGGKQLMFIYTSTTFREGPTGPYVGLTA